VILISITERLIHLNSKTSVDYKTQWIFCAFFLDLSTRVDKILAEKRPQKNRCNPAIQLLL